MRWRWLLLMVLVLAAWGWADETFIDTDGTFKIVLPAGWQRFPDPQWELQVAAPDGSAVLCMRAVPTQGSVASQKAAFRNSALGHPIHEEETTIGGLPALEQTFAPEPYSSGKTLWKRSIVIIGPYQNFYVLFFADEKTTTSHTADLEAVLRSFTPLAHVTTNQPAIALRDFFQLLSRREYKELWNAVSKETQDEFVRTASIAQKNAPDEVRSRFSQGDPEKDYWEAVRADAKPDELLANRTLSMAKVTGQTALVYMVGPGDQFLRVKMVEEDGSWKVGWKETFFPNGMDNPQP